MRNRITIQTTEELDQALEEVRIATGRATKSDVIRDGLELYDLVVQHLIAGKHLYLGTARESAGEVLLPHLERAAGRLRPVPARRDTAPLAVVPAPRSADEPAKPPLPARAHARRRSETP
jgi:hypothetical protein